MAVLNCQCRYSCTGLAVVAALILGIIGAFLQITGVIFLNATFLWVILGVAVVYLSILLATACFGTCSLGCSCCSKDVVLAGILGAAVLSIVLLGIPAASVGVTGAILSGGALFFFFLILFATACLARGRCAD